MTPGLIAGTLCLALASPPADAADTLPPAPPTVSEARKDALARFGMAVWHARRDQTRAAIRSLETAAAQDPDAVAPLKELVRVYSLIGREPDAVRVGRTVLEKDPADADTAHVLARLLFDSGDLTEAVGLARLAAEHVNPSDQPDKALSVYRDLATLLDRAGDPAGAVMPLRKAVELLTTNRAAVVATRSITPKEVDADAADTFERLGKVLVKAGRPDEAATAFLSAHKMYADPLRGNDPAAAARLNWNLCNAYAAKGDPAAALVHLELFLKLRPQTVEPYEQLVALLKQAGRGGEVVSTLRRHAARDPMNVAVVAVTAAELALDPVTRPEADAEFARLYESTNDPRIVRTIVRAHVSGDRAARVIADADRAFKILSKDDTPGAGEKREFAAEKARVLAEVLREDAEASAAVLRAVSFDLRAGTTRTHQTWQLLGVLATRHGKLDLAELVFGQALAAAPNGTRAEAYAGLIDVYRRTHQAGKLADLCREGLRSGDGVSQVMLNFHLALALAELGEGDEAIKTADKAISQAGDADRLTVRLRKADVFRTLARWDAAVGVDRKLLDEFDAPADRARIRYDLAASYWAAKKYTESEAELRTILDADPDHAGACNDLGYHLAEQGRSLDEAERLVRHAITVDRADRRKAGAPEPENGAYLDSLAWVLFRKGQLAEARTVLERASHLSDVAGDPVIWDHLGDVLFRLGEKPKARTAWERAAELYTVSIRGQRDGRFDELKRKLKRAL